MDKRKELKLAYKQTPRPMGIYQIKNTLTGKIFVDSSMNLSASSNSYLFKLKSKGHFNKGLQEDFNRYGSDVFSFEILETITPDETPKENWPQAVAELEIKWLNLLQPFGDRGYNVQKKPKA